MTETDTPLSAWCAARGLTAADLVRLTGCSVRAAQRWLAGRQTPGPAFREQLYRATGLQVFAPPARRGLPLGYGTSGSAARAESGAARAESGAARPSAEFDYRSEALAFRGALRQLEAALQPFAQGPAAARDCLRRAVDPSWVARVTNLAQMLFDEEAFADWLLLDTALGGEEGR